MKKFVIFLRHFLLAPFIIYVFDKMAVVLDIFIPMNIITVVIVGLFDIPGLIMLIIIYLIIVY